MWGRSGQNCSLLSQKRSKNLVIAALYLTGNRKDTTEFGVLWVLNTHTTDCAAKCHRYKHWWSLCKKPPTPKQLFVQILRTNFYSFYGCLYLEKQQLLTVSSEKIRCRPLMLSWHVRNSGLLLLDWGLIIWRIPCTNRFGALLHCSFAGFSCLLFPAFPRTKRYFIVS